MSSTKYNPSNIPENITIHAQEQIQIILIVVDAVKQMEALFIKSKRYDEFNDG